MPLPPLWQPNDELKNLIRKGMGKLAQGYLAAEDLYRQNVPAPVQEGISQLLDYGNQPQGFVPDSAIGHPQIDMMTRLDNIYPALYKAAAKIGPAAAVLAATVGGGGKASRSFDEAQQLLWTIDKKGNAPFWKASEDALAFLDKNGFYTPDLDQTEALNEAIKVLQTMEDPTPSAFKNLMIDRYRSRLINLQEAKKGSKQNISIEAPIGGKEGDIGNVGGTLQSTGLSKEAEMIADVDEAAAQATIEANKAAAQGVKYLDPMSAIKKGLFDRFAAEGWRSKAYKKVMDEEGNITKIEVPVSREIRPVYDVPKEYQGKTIGPMSRNYGIDSSRRGTPEELIETAKKRMANPTPEAYFGNFKKWMNNAAVRSEDAIGVLVENGATPYEAEHITQWVRDSRPFAFHRKTYGLAPARVGELISKSARSIADVNYMRKVEMKTAEKELAKTRAATERFLNKPVSNTPKDAFYGLPKGTPAPESMKDIQKKTIRKQLVKAMERGWF